MVILESVPHQQDVVTFEWVRAGCNCHQFSVGVNFVKLHEPCAILALWLELDAAQLQYLNFDPDHSVIDSKTYRGDSLPQTYAAPSPHQ